MSLCMAILNLNEDIFFSKHLLKIHNNLVLQYSTLLSLNSAEIQERIKNAKHCIAVN